MWCLWLGRKREPGVVMRDREKRYGQPDGAGNGGGGGGGVVQGMNVCMVESVRRVMQQLWWDGRLVGWLVGSGWGKSGKDVDGWRVDISK